MHVQGLKYIFLHVIFDDHHMKAGVACRNGLVIITLITRPLRTLWVSEVTLARKAFSVSCVCSHGRSWWSCENAPAISRLSCLKEKYIYVCDAYDLSILHIIVPYCYVMYFFAWTVSLTSSQSQPVKHRGSVAVDFFFTRIIVKELESVFTLLHLTVYRV